MQPIQVLIDGATIGDPILPPGTSFVLFITPSFTVTAGTHTLQFATTNSLGDNTTFIDVVTVNSASAPTGVQVSNAGFEVPYLGYGGAQYTGSYWTFSGNAGIQGNGSGWSSASAPGGSQAALLQANSSSGSTISQSIVFPAGAYVVSFAGARREGSAQPIQISLDGSPVGSPISPTSTNYSTYTSVAFTVSAGTHTIQFATTINSIDLTTFVDNVAITVATGLQFTNAPLAWGTVGTAYSQTLTASGSPTYAVTSGALPPGLGLNGVSGLISGTPTSGGVYSGVITASNGVDPSVTQAFTIAISTPYTIATFAGAAGSFGSVDGTGGAARFYTPGGTALDSSGNLYVADYNNNTIRKITPGGVVTTLAGLAGSAGSTDGTGTAARFAGPSGVAVDSTGNVFVADRTNHAIRAITPSGVVTTLAGSAGQSGGADGTGAAASFNAPSAIAIDAAGNLYIADAGNHTIRKVTPAGVASTVAGLAGTFGTADATGSAARFYFPNGVASDAAGNLVVADALNSTIRLVSSSGVVTTLAGTAGSSGSSDGQGAAARFNFPNGVAYDPAGGYFVTDYLNNTLRHVSGAGYVTTLAGSAASAGSTDGTGAVARFNAPSSVTVDAAGVLYITDGANHTIRIGVYTPVITSGTTATATVGAAFSYIVTATFSPTLYSATGLPAGLSLDPTSGIISGVPTTAGTVSVSLGAANPAGTGAATLVLTVGVGSQTIAFGALPTKIYGDPAFSLGATASSGLAPVYSIVSGPATVSGSTLTITGAGTVTVRAAQAGNGNYLAASPVDQAFSVAKAVASVTLSGLAATYDGTPKAVSAVTTPGALGVGFIYNGSATVPTAAGTYTVVGTVSDANYQGTATNTLVISASAQTVTFGSLSGKVFGDPSFALGATATSGLPPTFTIVSGPGALAGNVLTITGAGTIIVRASQAGDANYNAAAPVDQSCVVAKASASVTLTGLSANYDGTPKAAGATTIPGALTVGFTYNGSGTAPTVVGSYSVVGTINDVNYQGGASGTLVIGAANQTITFNPVSGLTYGDVPFAVTATASSGLPVSFAILSGPATLSGNVVTITASGSVTVRATQAGNSNFTAAAPVDQMFTVGRANQSVSFTNPSGVVYGAAPFPLVATASSGLSVVFSVVVGPATLSGNFLTITGAGTVTVRAAQAGDANYNPAPNVDQSFTVGRANQTISFGTLASKNYGDTAFAVAATADSGLAVGFSIINGPATCSGGVVTLTGAGTVTVRAAQVGNSNYNPAANVDRSFAVAPATLTVTPANASRPYGSANPSFAFVYSGFVGTDSAASLGALPSASTVASASSNAGTYPIVAAGASAANYTLIYSPGTLTVLPVNQTISFGPLAPRAFGDAPFSVSASATSGFAPVFAVVSGSASISGSVVTLTGAGSVTVRATQAGNGNYNAAPDVDQTFSVAKASAGLTLGGLAALFNGAPHGATAVTSPLGLTVDLTYNGSPTAPSAVGSYLVAAAINDVNYQGVATGTLVISPVPTPTPIPTPTPTVTPTPSPVPTVSPTPTPTPVPTIPPGPTPSPTPIPVPTPAPTPIPTLPVAPTPTPTPTPVPPTVAQTYFGNFDSGGPFALYIDANGRAALLGSFPDGRGAFVDIFNIDADGNFSITTAAAVAHATDTAVVAPTIWNFSGTVVNGRLVGHVGTTGETFSANASSPFGPAAGTAGYYPTPLLASSSGGVYTIINAAGQALSVIVLADSAEVSLGTVSSGGQLLSTTASGTTLTATVDASASVLQGTLAGSGGLAANVVGSAAFTPRSDRLGAISTRASVGTPGDGRVMIAGFVLNGTQSRPVLLRAVGPGLTALGVSGAVSHPKLQLFNSSGKLLLENSQWDSVNPDLAATFSRLGDFPLRPGSLDSAVITSLPGGAYTVHISDDSGSGVALGEIYDAGTAGDAGAAQIGALSTRGFVGANDNILIGGFVVTGQVSQAVLIRGLGPMLQRYGVAGVLPNPVLKVFDGAGRLVAQNDDWQVPIATSAGQILAFSPELAQAAAGSGAAPLDPGSHDAALLLNLAPGAYTAQVSSADGAGGVALVEFYLISR